MSPIERRSLPPPVSRRAFVTHLARQAGYASALVLVSLVLGMVGYHLIAHYSWVDSFLNACMLLGGMGPVGNLPNDASKIFAGIFALYSGLVFLASALFLLTPVFHRVLHYFHWEQSQREQK
jgi:hypothetical protein